MSRWTDVDEVKKIINSVGIDTVEDQIYVCELMDKAPSIDIVRCGECKWWIDNLTENDDDEAYDSCRWDWSRKIPTADDFCSYGEVRDE